MRIIGIVLFITAGRLKRGFLHSPVQWGFSGSLSEQGVAYT